MIVYKDTLYPSIQYSIGIQYHLFWLNQLLPQEFYSCGIWLQPPEVGKGQSGLRREQVSRLGVFWDM